MSRFLMPPPRVGAKGLTSGSLRQPGMGRQVQAGGRQHWTDLLTRRRHVFRVGSNVMSWETRHTHTDTQTEAGDNDLTGACCACHSAGKA
ncbi:hypothetical protein ElyMa_005906700 [Elysia marginata]|uniref:Uncharacterized protein n=1 Tax=Elysia marginata TaxID=1093978 RepID=A0AAV4G854_9GAST|nr:hypothetical protein ElyMa_005906700 [Elysia marginata]